MTEKTTNPIVTRTDELRHAVDAFNEIHDAWASNGQDDDPGRSYWNALENLIATFRADAIPADCRDLDATVHKLATEHLEFMHGRDTYPHNEFWAAREAMADARQNMDLIWKPCRESIQMLASQGVSHAQIAQDWGLVDAHGHPRMDLVVRELQDPGSVITPDYVHPADQERLAKIAQARTEYNAQVEAKPKPEPEGAEGKPCPETPWQLWAEAVPLPQAARMLRRPLAEVEALWLEFQAEAEQKAKDNASDKPAQKVGTGDPLEDVPNNEAHPPI